MNIQKINSNPNISFKARLKIKGKKFLTDEQFIILQKKAMKIGKKNDTIYFDIEKVQKEPRVNLSDGIEYYNVFRRYLFAYNKIGEKLSNKVNLMGHLTEVSKKDIPDSNSKLNAPFEFMQHYIDSLYRKLLL